MPNETLDKNPALLRPTQGGATVNADLMAAPAMAGAKVGSAIEGAGMKAYGIAQKMQERKNAGQLSDLRRQMREHRAAWERDTMPGTPPEDRLESWEQAANQFTAGVGEQEMAPAARSAFEQTYNDSRGDSGLQIQAGA